MKKCKKLVFRVSISTLLLQLIFGVNSLPVYAVSPGWSTESPSTSSVNSSSKPSSSDVPSSSDSSSSEPIGQSSSSAENPSESNDSSSSSSYVPAQSSEPDSSESKSSGVSSSSSSNPSSSVAQSSSDKSSSDPISQSSKPEMSRNSSSSSGQSSSRTVPESIKSYSIDELLQDANSQYELRRNNLISENKQLVTDNNNKGANELYAAYQTALKKIKSGKTTLQEREESVATQKSALQEALSARLNSLQDIHNQNVQVVQNKINVLPSDHAHDKEALKLQDQLTALDYDLSHNSNLAYTRYNNAVAKLNKQAEHVSVESKKDQRSDAKSTYLENLSAVRAQDPKSLNKQNAKKLSDLKSKYKSVKKMIKNKDISTPFDIEKYF